MNKITVQGYIGHDENGWKWYIMAKPKERKPYRVHGNYGYKSREDALHALNWQLWTIGCNAENRVR